MSTVMIVAPLVIANWSVISAAVMGAIGTVGFTAVAEQMNEERASGVTRAEIELEDSEVLEAAGGSGETIVVERDECRAIFSRDARGTLKVCVEGSGYSKAQLKAIGEELIGRVTQQYVYNRVVTELHDRNMTIVSEDVAADQTVKIRVRNW